MEPIMKWAGGKRQLLGDIKSVININELAGHRLYEPFVGGGAFFLDLEHDNVLINDINKELINVYLQVRDDPTQLINLLKKHRDNHSRDYYYEIRNYDRNGKIEMLSNVEQAARTIYLNRVCYNGLYRVNASGQFNVPFGKYTNPEIVSENKIKEISNYLNNKNIEITSVDFAQAVQDAAAGDLVYFDPPYDYNEGGFTSYTRNGFSRDDLRKLKNICDVLIAKGCKVVISNNETSFVDLLFNEPKYQKKYVMAKRMINCKGQRRSCIKEVIIYG